MSGVLFVIDSSPAVHRIVQEAARLADCDLVAFRDGLSALDAAPTLKPELVLADYHMEGVGFTTFCQRLRGVEGTADSPVVGFITFSDQLDEGLLRSFGVKALLTKPLHPDHLVQTIRRLRAGTAEPEAEAAPRISLAASSSRLAGIPLQRPDTDDPHPSPAATADPPAPPAAAPAAQPATLSSLTRSSTAVERAVRELTDLLSDLARAQAREAVAADLPDLVAAEVRAHLPRAIQAELPAIAEAAVPKGAVEELTRDAVRHTLPEVLTQQLNEMEPAIRQHLTAIARPFVERVAETVARELVGPAVQQHLAGALREHVGPVEQLVKDAVEAAVREQVGRAAETGVRDVAREVTRQAAERIVRDLVPDLAEAAIKDEIQRLTA